MGRWLWPFGSQGKITRIIVCASVHAPRLLCVVVSREGESESKKAVKRSMEPSKSNMRVDDVPPAAAPIVDSPPELVQPATTPELRSDYPLPRGSAAAVDPSTGPVAMQTKTEAKPPKKSGTSAGGRPTRSASVTGVIRSRSRSDEDKGKDSAAE